jgi:hypothetical protein
VKKYTIWIVTGLALAMGLVTYFWYNRKPPVSPMDYVPRNAAFVIKFKARNLSQIEIEELSEYNLPPNMLKRLFGNKEKPGPLGNSDMVLFGEQTPAGPAIGILFTPEDQSAFSKIVSETHYTGTPINIKEEIQFIEFNTGFYLSWNNEIAMLSYQLTSGDTYPLSILNSDKEKSGLPERIKTDSVQCTLKPSPMLQMFNYEKPSKVLSAIAGIIPENTTLSGQLKTTAGLLQLDMDVIEGAKELEALLKLAPGKEDCGNESSDKPDGTLIYLALQKPMIAGIAALTGQTGNPLLPKLNGNACLWLPASDVPTENTPWTLWLGADLTPPTKAMLQQLPEGMTNSPIPGMQLNMAGNCLQLNPLGQSPTSSGYQKPGFPLEFHRRTPENTLKLTGNSRNMQLVLQSQTTEKSTLMLLLNTLGRLIPKQQPQP